MKLWKAALFLVWMYVWSVVLVCALARAQERLDPGLIELGRALYHDTRMSADNTTGCFSCHKSELGFTDGLVHARGRRTPQNPDGIEGLVNTPSNENSMAGDGPQFHDGRALTPIEQALGPIENVQEMGGRMTFGPRRGNTQTKKDVVDRVNGIAGYRPLIRAAYGRDFLQTPEEWAEALVEFQRTFVNGDTPMLRYLAAAQDPAAVALRQKYPPAFAGVIADPAALSDAGRKFYPTFVNVCVACHTPPFFGGAGFANNGMIPRLNDDSIGLEKTTGQPADRGREKVRSLVNVGMRGTHLTHTGRFTLEQCVHFYFDGAQYKQDGQLTRDSNCDARVPLALLSKADETRRAEFEEYACESLRQDFLAYNRRPVRGPAQLPR